jgi:colanic acid biosynthesis glycosyl transferase WcaI
VRFLILTQYFPPEVGAPQVRLQAFARALKRNGHHVEIVTAMPNHLTGRILDGYRRKFYVTEDLDGSTVRRTWIFAATGAGGARIINYLSFMVTCLFGMFRSARPDYVFVESPPLFLGVPGWFYCALRRTRMIFNVADLWPDSVRALGVINSKALISLAGALERWIYSRARFVNAVTTGIQRGLIKKGVPEPKVLFLPNGVDTTLFTPRDPDLELLRQLGLNGSRVFLYAGTHGLAQDLDTIVAAAALLQGTSARFLFVGDGPTKRQLEQTVEQRRLKNVVFVGMQPLNEMPRFFSLAFASIAPLRKRELFKGARPSKIFPSLASGVPVIFCGEGEAADLLVKHSAGIAVEPENAAALAGAVRQLLDNPGRRTQMSANGRRLALEQFDWGALVEQWLEQLRKAEQAA